MNYTCEAVINLPRERVISLFDDPANLVKWQPGLVSFEPLAGVRGQPGAQSRLTYRMGRRTIEMVETVTTRNLPHEFSGTCATQGGRSAVRNEFHEVAAGRTRWVAHSEYRCDGLLMRLMNWLMPGAFRRQTQKFMEQFKAFAETAGAG